MTMILGFAPLDRRLNQPIPQRCNVNGYERWRIQNFCDALAAICDGRWDEAEETLNSGNNLHFPDASVLNLLGIIYQARRQWKQARRFYGKATVVDPSYAPAEQNLRRLYELHTFGRTDLPILLIDPAIAAKVESRFDWSLMRQ
jgi:tetratricopeptide (TPR) repeat protein